jgi:predicted SprT family Zn-dependent metalloprotease
MTEAELNALYDELNRVFFGGRLPNAGMGVNVAWRHPPDGRTASTKHFSAFGSSIWISPIYASVEDHAWVRRVLLHEMCHLEAGPPALEEGEHGPRWQAAMTCLYEQGEAWVLEDLARMAELTAEEDRFLKLISGEMARLDPALDWQTVMRSKYWSTAREFVEGSPRVYLAWLERFQRAASPDGRA